MQRGGLVRKAVVGKSDKDMLMELEGAWREALRRRDTTALNALLSDGFQSKNTDREVRNREEYLGEIRSADYEVFSIQAGHLRVRISGDRAVVRGIARVTLLLEGQTLMAKFRYLHLYVKEGKRWRAAEENTEQIKEP